MIRTKFSISNIQKDFVKKELKKIERSKVKLLDRLLEKEVTDIFYKKEYIQLNKQEIELKRNNITKYKEDYCFKNLRDTGGNCIRRKDYPYLTPIFEYWENILSFKLRVPETCFACQQSKKVEYCHLNAVVFGGENQVSNIILLCYQCHKLFDTRFSGYLEDRNNQIKWVQNRADTFYEKSICIIHETIEAELKIEFSEIDALSVMQCNLVGQWMLKDKSRRNAMFEWGEKNKMLLNYSKFELLELALTYVCRFHKKLWYVPVMEKEMKEQIPGINIPFDDY